MISRKSCGAIKTMLNIFLILKIKERIISMKCPHCGQSLGDQKCSACGTELLPASNFCHQCGISLKSTAPSVAEVEEEEEIDFSKRILCSDGTCIGVINEKGICKVCGKPYAG